MPTVLHSLVRTAAALAVILPAWAGAQTFQGTARYDGPQTQASANGYYVGPQNGTFFFPAAGAPGQSVNVTLFCVDFLNGVSAGQSWTANVSPLAGSAPSLALTRNPNGLAGYRKAVWLADQFSVQPPADWGGIQAAIWKIFGSGSYDGNPVKSGSSPVASDARNEVYWTAQANAFAASTAFGTYDYSRYGVITATTAAGVRVGSGPQEFIGRVVPEPGTLALLATGAIGIAAWGGRSRRRRGDEDAQG